MQLSKLTGASSFLIVQWIPELTCLSSCVNTVKLSEKDRRHYFARSIDCCMNHGPKVKLRFRASWRESDDHIRINTLSPEACSLSAQLLDYSSNPGAFGDLRVLQLHFSGEAGSDGYNRQSSLCFQIPAWEYADILQSRTRPDRSGRWIHG